MFGWMKIDAPTDAAKEAAKALRTAAWDEGVFIHDSGRPRV
jgi:hypothetical protein